MRAARVAPRLACVIWPLYAACAQRIPPPADPGPALERPAAAIPADLDVALRLDLDAARALFGPSIAQALELDVADRGEDAATASLVSSAAAHAHTLWVALRPGLPTRLTDNVMVLRGDFGDFDPRAPAKSDWRAPRDLGGGWQVYDRSRPRRRSAPSRIYVRGGDWIVFVSEAEVDSAERAIERRVRDEHVDPPDRGLLSFAARAEQVAPFFGARFPIVSEALKGATLVQGSASADDRGLDATIEARFSNEADAAAGRERLQALIDGLRRTDGLFARLSRGARANVVGSTLVLRLVLDAKAFAPVVECVGAGAGC